MAANYVRIPILEAARRCGLALDHRTLRREEVEASCPFCGDHGRGKYHLSLNARSDQYRCNLCGASGNSVTLYARVMGVTNGEAYRELTRGGRVYLLPREPAAAAAERQPCELRKRHQAYSEMLFLLTLRKEHYRNLRERGLSDERIQRNEYRSMPETPEGRRLLAKLLGENHDLLGLPGFYTSNGRWTLAGPDGFLIPVRDKNGMIQGLKIRLDSGEANRKYRWLSSRGRENGTRSYSWIHVTGRQSGKRAFLTEGPLKGDVASFLSGDELFLCIGGVNATNGLADAIRELGITEIIEAMDSDQMVKPEVRRAVLSMRKELTKLPNIRYLKYTWDPAYKGVDDYLLNRAVIR